MEKLKLAVVGCGAVAEEGYLPAIRSNRDVELAWVIDRDEGRCRAMADQFGSLRYGTDHRAAVHDTDAAVVATPPDSHRTIATDFMANGVHVLCEKPLALSVRDAQAIVEAAARHGIHCAVVRNRRFARWVQATKRILDLGWIGDIEGFSVTEGHKLNWPARSAYRARTGAGGVLWDWGPHVLDLVAWFTGVPLHVRSFVSDDLGGVEANCWIELEGPAEDGRRCGGTIELSATRRLANAWRIKGSKADLVAHTDVGTVVINSAEAATRPLYVSLNRVDSAPTTWPAQMAEQLTRFVDNVLTGAPPDVPAAEAIPVLAMIEGCMLKRRVERRAWEEVRGVGDRRSMVDTRARADASTRILVTGATGFIGGRLAERLALEEGHCVRALSRSLGGVGLARLARGPIDIVYGDLRAPDAVDEAMRGCTIVVHCAVGGSGPGDMYSSTVQGTANLLRAASAAGVDRFVHLSTAVVHGRRPPMPVVTEDSPFGRDGDAYAKAKIAAEELVWRAGEQGLPVVIFRPPIVYGPLGGWSLVPLDEIRRGATLVEDGRGAANLIYVDNLVDALIASLHADEAIGQAFIAVDDDEVTWKEYYEAYRRMMDDAPPLRSVSMKEWRAHVRNRRLHLAVRSTFFPLTIARRAASHLLRSASLRDDVYSDFPWLGRLATKIPDRVKQPLRARVPSQGPLVGTLPPLRFPSDQLMSLHVSRARFSNEKAKRLLGWKQRVSFSEAQSHIADWLRFESLHGED